MQLMYELFTDFIQRYHAIIYVIFCIKLILHNDYCLHDTVSAKTFEKFMFSLSYPAPGQNQTVLLYCSVIDQCFSNKK